MIENMDTPVRADGELVAKCLAGNRDAFRLIVERYQNLICSVAYNGTGDVSRSEDIAQETFITAWRSLGSLREPEKLRGWLCGIVRQHLRHHWRASGREPVANASELEADSRAASTDASPPERTMSVEEQQLLWRCLARLPETYREPLILFYREYHSVEHVAAALELSEDAVKQRLARGRKLLADEMLGFIETGLQRTAPTRAFTLDVLVLLSGVAAPGAATTGVLAPSGVAAAKTGWLATLLVPLAPFLGIGAGMGAQWLLIRDLSPDRRSRIRRAIGMVLGWVVFLALAVFGENAVNNWANAQAWNDRRHFVAVIVYWWIFLVAIITLQFFGFGGWARRARARTTGLETSVALSPTTGAATAFGVHVIFAWLPTLAWKMGDHLGAGLIAAALLALTLRAWWRLRGVAAARLGPVMAEHLAWIGGLILFSLNARADVWVSLRYGVPLSEASNVLPLYWIPILSVAFAGWVLGMIAVAGYVWSARRDKIG